MRSPAWAMRSTSGTFGRRSPTDHHGKIVSIDVGSGNWAIGDSILEAVDRLRAQCPDAIDVWSLRVGYLAVHKFGGGSLGIIR